MEDLLDSLKYIELVLKVRTKDAKTLPFRLNPIQQIAHKNKARRNIWLKPRQIGLSTWLLADNFADVATRPNWFVRVVANDADTTEKLFQTVRFFYDNLPKELKPVSRYENRRELYFPALNSGVDVMTAGSNSPGRGVAINALHCSEVAFWLGDPEAILAGMLESVPLSARVDLESTANGVGGLFYSKYMLAKAGEGEYKPHFFPWWLDPGYKLTNEQAKELGVNPYQPLSQEETVLCGKVALDSEQINWRRWKKTSIGRLFAQEYPEDEDTCFLVSGSGYFDSEAITRAKQIGEREPLEVEDNGHLKIWQEPIAGQRYFIGADVAEGLNTGDFSAAYVLNQAGEIVASLHGHWEPHSYAVKLDKLGRQYNNALLAVERNNHGHAVLSTLVFELEYPNLYKHEDYDSTNGDRPGWVTSSKTKPIAINNLAEMLKEAPECFHDMDLFQELRTFTEQNGKLGASVGCFDDRVMALAIALTVRIKRAGMVTILDSYRQRYQSLTRGGVGDMLGGLKGE